MNLKYDSMASVFNFDFYFDPNNKKHAELACVSHYHEAIVEHNGEKIITGYILAQDFTDEPKDTLVQIAGYSKPGVFEDCEIPTSLYPLQSDGLSLREIAKKIIDPFKIKLVVDDVAKKDASISIEFSQKVKEKLDKKIDTSTAKESQNIKSYLTELAMQRNVDFSHNEEGDLLITEARTNATPIFEASEGMIGVKMKLKYNGQPIHSQITVIKQADTEGGNAGEFTIKNPYCPIVFRPKVIVQSSGDDNTIEETAKNALAAELKNINLVITIDRWDVNGKIIRPNNMVAVKNRKLFLYNRTLWFIESIQYTGNSKQTTAELTCVLPEVYNGKTPKNIFVDPHQNLPRF